MMFVVDLEYIITTVGRERHFQIKNRKYSFPLQHKIGY